MGGSRKRLQLNNRSVKRRKKNVNSNSKFNGSRNNPLAADATLAGHRQPDGQSETARALHAAVSMPVSAPVGDQRRDAKAYEANPLGSGGNGGASGRNSDAALEDSVTPAGSNATKLASNRRGCTVLNASRITLQNDSLAAPDPKRALDLLMINHQIGDDRVATQHKPQQSAAVAEAAYVTEVPSAYTEAIQPPTISPADPSDCCRKLCDTDARILAGLCGGSNFSNEAVEAGVDLKPKSVDRASHLQDCRQTLPHQLANCSGPEKLAPAAAEVGRPAGPLLSAWRQQHKNVLLQKKRFDSSSDISVISID